MISGPVPSGDGVRTRAALPARPRVILLAGVLAVVSIALPWSAGAVAIGSGVSAAELSGTTHAVRVIAPAAAALLWWAVHRGSTRGALGALLLAATALPIGLSTGLAGGRIVYLMALAVAAVAVWRPAAGPGAGGGPEPR
ncbi:MAG TPA: hypothetical protein VFP72_07800 [Kineosporiaceae bacterium]|nr:hypothetical protein [Kineosporiaceae bacterium]